MKVLFWLNIGLGGHSTSGHLLTAIMEQVSMLGHEVHVLQKDNGSNEPLLPEHLEKAGVTTTAVPFRAAPKANFAKRYLAELKYIRESARLIGKDYAAIFIQSNIAAGFSVREAERRNPKAKIIYNVQDVYPQDVFYAGKIGRNNPAYIAMRVVQRYAYRHADEIITISEDMKDLIVAEGADAARTMVIYNWSYRDSLFEQEEISPEVSKLFDQSLFNVVYAGNIGLFQNVDVVVDAAADLKQHKDIQFHIFGDGLYKEKLRERAERENIDNIKFHPIQPHELAPSVYASASVNLIPLGKNQFRAALPSKTATCLACQRPIIFAIGKESKYGQKVSSETGCPLVECSDHKALANAILEIKEHRITVKTGQFFLDNCSITRNSRLYAQRITSVGGCGGTDRK